MSTQLEHRNSKWEPSCCWGATVLTETPKASVRENNQSRSRTFCSIPKIDTNTVIKLGETQWCKFFSPLQVTTSSLRPSTCRRMILWWSKTTGRPCFPSTFPTNRPLVPTTTWATWGRIRWSGSMNFPARMKGGQHAVLPLPWCHMSYRYLKTGGL